MNNYNSDWRIWAKTVAFIDLVFVAIQLLLSLVLIFLAGTATVALSDSYNHADIPEGASVITWVIWFIVAVQVIQTGIALWADVQLIKATEVGLEARNAYKYCQIWQIVCFVFIVLTIIGGCMTGAIVWMVVVVLVRVIFMYIVFRFMQDVQTAFIAAPHQMTQKV